MSDDSAQHALRTGALCRDAAEGGPTTNLQRDTAERLADGRSRLTLRRMASFEDAAAGWETYRDRDGAVTRSQLNQALRMRGFEPISNRTYAHYNKLLRLGYTEYVSINRLDIRHANDSLFDVTD